MILFLYKIRIHRLFSFDGNDGLGLERLDKNQLKKDMLKIYESTLAGAIKMKNTALAKKSTTKYASIKPINLFDE
jgi:hypothetical protein